MKKAIALSMALVSSASLPLAAQADDIKTDVKQATVFTTAGILESHVHDEQITKEAPNYRAD